MAPVLPLVAIHPAAAGFVLSLAVSLTARAFGWLTTNGAVAAIIVGTLVFAWGGWEHAGLLVLFFTTSSLLTRWHAARKPHPEHTTGRTAAQVLANATVVTILSVWGSVRTAPWVDVAFAGAIAAAAADAWATEIGLLSASHPRLITVALRRRGATVPPGTPGGVSWLGTIAACAASTLIAGGSTILLATPLAPVWVGGVFGMAIDSLLGATVEGRWGWMTNNAVNLLATVGGATCAAALGRL
jgi:uncharacterized protein (TIGR00297 family)